MTNTETELEQKFGGRLDTTSMRDFDYKGKPVFWLRFSGGHCPICGEANGWCVVNVTGTKVICMKTPNNHPFGQGYLYYLNDNHPVKFDPKNVKKDNTYKFSNPSVSGEVNRLVANFYNLSDSDRKNLHDRGLDDAHINLHPDGGFGTITKKTQAVAQGSSRYSSVWTNLLEQIKQRKDAWKGVMGFYGLQIPDEKQPYEIPMYNVSSFGMLVPYFSVYNEILGFQVRLNNPPVKTSPMGQKGPNGGLMMKNGTELTIELKNYQREYEVVAKTAKGAAVIAKGKAVGMEYITGVYKHEGVQENYVFELKPENKYRWVSSRNKNHGASGHGQHMPIEVAYNDQVAKLSPKKPDEKALLDSYIKQEKGVWLTEGGLKALVTAANLPKQFTDKELDLFGRDVLAVAGVTSYADFLPVLRRLHVTRATIAFDMDLLENDNVLTSTTKLVNMLIDNGIEVYLSSWDGKKAKGIDDALTGQVKVTVQKL